jgi:hypothetical protein
MAGFETVRDVNINTRDDGEEGPRVTHKQMALQLLDEEGDIAYAAAARDTIPRGTILIELDSRPFQEGEIWFPHRFRSLGQALLTVRSIIRKGELKLRKKDMPEAERNHLLAQDRKARRLEGVRS